MRRRDIIIRKVNKAIKKGENIRFIDLDQFKFKTDFEPPILLPITDWDEEKGGELLIGVVIQHVFLPPEKDRDWAAPFWTFDEKIWLPKPIPFKEL